MKVLGSAVAVLAQAVAALGLLAVDGATMSTAQAQSAPIKLVMVGAWKPGVSAAADIGIKYMETVNKLSGGKIQIKFKGASDVDQDLRSARSAGERRVRHLVRGAKLLGRHRQAAAM